MSDLLFCALLTKREKIDDEVELRLEVLDVKDFEKVSRGFFVATLTEDQLEPLRDVARVDIKAKKSEIERQRLEDDDDEEDDQ